MYVAGRPQMMASSAPPALAAPRRSSVIQPCKGDPHLTLATLRGQMGAWQSKHPSTRTQTRSAKGYGAAAKGQMVDSDAVPALASGGGGGAFASQRWGAPMLLSGGVFTAVVFVRSKKNLSHKRVGFICKGPYSPPPSSTGTGPSSPCRWHLDGPPPSSIPGR